MSAAKTRPYRRVLALFVVIALALMMVPATAGAVPPGCDNRNNNTIRKLLECVTVEGVREHQAALQEIADENGGNRASGLPGYDASVDYAVDVLAGAGYDVTVQEFEFEFFDDNSTLTVGGTAFPVLSAQFTPPVAGAASGPIVPVDLVIPPGPVGSNDSGCTGEPDFAGFPAGGIALIQRGFCAFTEKVLNAQAAGASGVILFNEGQPGRTGFIIPIGAQAGMTIPTVATDFANGSALAALAGQQASLNAEFILDTRLAENVFAETKNGDDDNVVMVGGHLDSVPEGPGINDNGSGSAAILDVAEAMRKFKPTNTVRFALWGAEEQGLLGSDFYIDNLPQAERDKIALYLNFDMVGSSNYVRFVYDGDGSAFNIPGPPGSAEIEALFTGFYSGRGLASEPTAFDGRSDYGPFIAVGIPAGGLFTGAEGIKTLAQQAVYGGTVGQQFDPCYHEACDTFDNVSEQVLDLNADAIAFATMTYANSTASLGSGAATAAATARVAGQEFVIKGNRAEG
jgi:Zn-dependent M28 family amino/carboxypeptidase